MSEFCQPPLWWTMAGFLIGMLVTLYIEFAYTYVKYDLLQ